MLAVAPGPPWAILVATLPARDADHLMGIPRCEMTDPAVPVPADPAAALPFPDRRAAGRLLAARLLSLVTERCIVLALPRGGVPVAVEIGARLAAPVDVLVTRKIGYPPQPELGVGAIAEGGEPVFDERMLSALRLRASDLGSEAEREREEVARRVQVYRSGRPLPDVRGRTVVLADDGLATGVTARAAVRALRAAGADRTVLAVPVASEGAVVALQAETDEVVTLVTPRRFRSVGEWYASFGQLSDADVLALLNPGG